MTGFLYSVYLPGIKQTVDLTELYFNIFKHLVKILTNDNNEYVAKAFEEVLQQCSTTDISKCSVIDKAIALLTIRSICLSPVLELVITCQETKKQYNASVEINELIEKLQKIAEADITQTKQYSVKNTTSVINVTYDVPSVFFVSEKLESLQSVINTVTLNDISTRDTTALVDILPAAVLQDAKQYIINLNETLSNNILLNLSSPFSTTAEPILITANVFDGSLLELIKICFKRSLMSIYELEYFLLKHLKMDYNSIHTSTPAELTIYSNLFKEEQKEQEKLNKESDTESIPLKPL
jgi:hypothetical protein